MGVTIATRLPESIETLGKYRYAAGKPASIRVIAPRAKSSPTSIATEPLTRYTAASTHGTHRAIDPMKQHLAVSAIGSDRTGMV